MQRSRPLFHLSFTPYSPPMTEKERIEKLMHAAGNCQQMLHAIDRRLARALQCLETNDVDECRKLLDGLTTALPAAIAILSQHHEADG